MSSEEKGLPITPETRVAALLDAYPRLEETLVRLAPTFAKLRNPVLRRTVAKVTTLRQAAKVGGVSLGTLINTLRDAAGVTGPAIAEEEATAAAGAPAWFDESSVAERLDARPMIEAGERPMAPVLARLEHLAEGAVFELTTPFVPAPLMDMAVQKGFRVWHRQEGPEVVKTYFTRATSR